MFSYFFYINGMEEDETYSSITTIKERDKVPRLDLSQNFFLHNYIFDDLKTVFQISPQFLPSLSEEKRNSFWNNWVHIFQQNEKIVQVETELVSIRDCFNSTNGCKTIPFIFVFTFLFLF